jgi:hypothetical protein
MLVWFHRRHLSEYKGPEFIDVTRYQSEGLQRLQQRDEGTEAACRPQVLWAYQMRPAPRHISAPWLIHEYFTSSSLHLYILYVYT